jgi:hypothetical protein
MEASGGEIVERSESELVLSKFSGVKWPWKLLSVLAAVLLVVPLLGEHSSLLLFCGSSLIIAPIVFALWQYAERTTRIQFNNPVGFLTIDKVLDWGIFLPAGIHFINETIQVPLPSREVILEVVSGTEKKILIRKPEPGDIRVESADHLQVKVLLEDGDHYIVWSTDDDLTIAEVVNRINASIKENRWMIS